MYKLCPETPAPTLPAYNYERDTCFSGVIQPQIHTLLLYLGLKGTPHTLSFFVHAYNACLDPNCNESCAWIQCALKGSNVLHSLQFPDVISVTYYLLLCHVTCYITRYCKKLYYYVTRCITPDSACTLIFVLGQNESQTKNL